MVVASLSSARTKARHASIKSKLRNAVTQAQLYYSENGTYTGLCNDATIQNIVSALGNNSRCYVHEGGTILRDIDFGLAATHDNIHFTADPQGVLQLDTANTGGTQSWDSAMASCSGAGKRLPGISSLMSLRNIFNSVPPGFSNSYWSITQQPQNSSEAYRLDMDVLFLGSASKTLDRSVRCGA